MRGIFIPFTISDVLWIPVEKVWHVLKTVPLPFDFSHQNAIEYVSQLERHIYMKNQLLKDADYMSMWHGIEVRVPFLDIELLVFSIPPALRFKCAWPKFLLTASNQSILPHEIIFGEKKGFTFPYSVWMKRNLNRFKSQMQISSSTKLILADFDQGKRHWSFVWMLVVLNQFGNKKGFLGGAE